MTRQIQSSESASEAVVKAVSAAEDCPPTSLPPLYNAVNPEALDKVFTGTTSDVPDRNGQIAFQYGDYVVTITENEHLSVQESMTLTGDEEFYG